MSVSLFPGYVPEDGNRDHGYNVDAARQVGQPDTKKIYKMLTA